MDLSLCSTDDLLEEIFARYDHACFAGIDTKVPGEIKAGFQSATYIEARRYKGNLCTVIGMAERLKFKVVLDELRSDREDLDDLEEEEEDA